MITILGATGQLGSAFRSLIPQSRFLDRRAVNLSRPKALVSALNDVIDGPVINCAAWTDVDGAESREVEATIVNGSSVGLMAQICNSRGVPFITFSSDYVFSGSTRRPYRTTDDPRPVNAYGRSKLRGETAALEFKGTLVIRTSWLQSSTHPCFIRTVMQRATEGRTLKVVDDQVGSPTFVQDLAQTTLAALGNGAQGIVHVANEGVGTWYDLAKRTLEFAGLVTRTELTSCATADFPSPAQRPPWSVLDTSGNTAWSLPPLPHWETALAETVQEIQTSLQGASSQPTIRPR